MAFFDHFFSSEGTAAGRWLDRRRHEFFFREVRKFMRPGAAILEVGPGRGEFARLCVKAGYRYKGVEANEGAVERLRADGLDVRYAMVPPVPFDGERFDCICAADVLEHMPSYQVASEFLASCREHLAPGGAIVILSPELRAWGIDFWRCDPTHQFPTGAGQVVTMFHDLGLVPRSCAHSCGPFSGVARYPVHWANKLNPWNLIESLWGAKWPPRRWRNLKMCLLERFIVAGQLPGGQEEKP